MRVERLIKAVGAWLVVVFAVTTTMGGNVFSSILVTLVPCTIGVVTGCLIYYIVSGGANHSLRVRFAGGSVSGTLSAALDWFVFVHSAKSGFNISQFTVMVNIGIAYTCLVAGVLGLLFGANVLYVFGSENSGQ